jgi:hypothetical protein
VALTGNGLTVPTGTVTFTADGNSMGTSCTNVALTSKSGVTSATCKASLPVGSYRLRAHYSGDATYASGSDSIVSYPVNRAVTTTVVSATKKTAKVGATVTVTATTKHVGGPAHPTGTVVIFNDGAKMASKSESATGKVSAKIKIRAGQNDIEAVYSGSTNYQSSTGHTLVKG